MSRLPFILSVTVAMLLVWTLVYNMHRLLQLNASCRLLPLDNNALVPRLLSPLVTSQSSCEVLRSLAYIRLVLLEVKECPSYLAVKMDLDEM